MKKKASNFKLLPSQKIKILHTQKVAPVFNFYRALHFFAKVLFATVSFDKWDGDKIKTKSCKNILITVIRYENI